MRKAPTPASRYLPNKVGEGGGASTFLKNWRRCELDTLPQLCWGSTPRGWGPLHSGICSVAKTAVPDRFFPNHGGGFMHRILYTSSRSDDTNQLGQSPDFACIGEHAARNNAKLQITGFLICTPTWYAQVLEG